MADIAPFRGVLYNPEAVGDLEKVVTPPYDVISPDEQEEFYRRHPLNVVRLILNRNTPEDTEENNPHTRAAATLRKWLAEGVLVRDEEPGLYYYEIDYELPDGDLKTREGFVCLLRLEDFKTGRVRPHEKTFERTRSERLRLIRRTRANLSQVFCLYADPENEVADTMKAARDREAVMDFEDYNRVYHRMWRVTDEEAIARVAGLMAPREIFIADGHHRYETSLAFRDEMRERHPEAGADAPFNFIMVYLSNMDHPGVTILPTHRMLKQVDGYDPGEFLARAGECFDIREIPSGRAGARDELLARLKGHKKRGGAFGHFAHGHDAYWLLTLKDRSALAGVRPDLSPTLRDMDVVVLDELILKHLVGVDAGILGGEDKIRFTHDAVEALAGVAGGDYRMVFLINPTRIDQVKRVAEASLVMPHKATYFYPKVIVGSVLFDMDDLSPVAVPGFP